MAMISPALELFHSYRFSEAVETFKRQLRDGSGCSEWANSVGLTKWINMAGLAEALMAAGEYAEAIPYMEKTDEKENEVHGVPGRAEQLSICHWMIGERAQALDIIKNLVAEIHNRRINHTDISGGVPYGLVYCYMAATLHSPADVDLAMKYLKRLVTRPWIKNWPGPAAQFLLGQRTFADVVIDATGFANLSQAKRAAEQDSAKRRRLIATLFAAATERRMGGDEPGCRAYMAECASLTIQLIAYEWHLAKGEVAAAA